MSKNKVWVYLDADPLLFECTEGKFTKGTVFGAEKGEVNKKGYKEPLKPYKKKFKQLVKDIEDEVSVATLGVRKVKGIKVIISDPKKNFRYEIYPSYKANRDSGDRGPLFYRLRKWALKRYGYVKGIEADDLVAHYVRKGHIGASMDKDLLRGVAGTWFDTYHTRRTINTVTYQEARNFNYIQTLMGDPTDNIKALPKKAGDPMIPVDNLPQGKRQPYKVTEKIACDILDEFGWCWEGVLKGFESRGFGKKEMELNARLILLDQWSPKKGVKLFKYKLT